MGNLQGFDARNVEPNAAFEVIAPGDYEAVIVASEMKTTKNGSGAYLELQLKIISGKYQNRTIKDRLNLHNQSAQTVQIAQGTLSAICRAVGVLTPADSSELHMKPLRITVAVKKRSDTNEMQAEIKGYKPRSAGPASSSAMVTADSGGQYVATGPAKAPWQN